MLHKETVADGTLNLIKQLSSLEELADFRLVGGTALSLQIGPRMSVDIDFFTDKSFLPEQIADKLKASFNAENVILKGNAISCKINGVKIDIVKEPVPFVKPAVKIEDVRMATVDEIGGMKLHLMWDRGHRMKDFVDMYFILEHKSLNECANTCLQKYPVMDRQKINSAMAYHHDIKFDYQPHLLRGDIHWKKMAARLQKAVKFPDRRFLPEMVKQMKSKRPKKK
ncbi:MAG TPA: nucleotidyl transferase AbiEii/AbiGii toxin family protein [Chitinophagaceae bacterium]|nr:nucleotidyl transferase AbiEii/AbiGii toxin family protein [Chitinophagaceae bacterium]